VFLAPKPRQGGQPPLLGDIRSNFPLPGKYHFRFKTSPIPSGEHYGKGNNMSVWMDCVDDKRPVPFWRNSIVAKITRISAEDDDDDSDFAHEGTNNVETNGHSNANYAPTPPTTDRPSQVSPQPTPSQPTENLLYGFDEAPAPEPPLGHVYSSTPTSSSGSLLDMGAPPSVVSNPSFSHDVFGGAPAPAQPHANYPGGAHDELLSMGMPNMPQQAAPQRVASNPQVQHMAPNTGTTVNQYANQAHQQNIANPNNPQTTFDSYSQNKAPFGNLNWN